MACDPSSSRPRPRKPPASSAALTATLPEPAKTLQAKIESTVLLLWDELPSWQRDNAFLKTGYRPMSNSYRRSFASIRSLHNETVNIWSHLLGAAFFLIAGTYAHALIAPRYATAGSSDVLVFACFFGGAVACLTMSATFHALSNHSPHVARWGNKLDYTGIVFLIVGSYVPALYYGLFCLPGWMTVYLFAICLLGLGCGIVSWLEHFRTPQWRAYRATMFVALGLSGIIPIIHSLRLYGYERVQRTLSLDLVVLHGVFYILGALLYAIRWPERSFPYVFDIWGSSHQIFHFCVILAAGTHFYAMAEAFDYHHSVMGAQCSELQ